MFCHVYRPLFLAASTVTALGLASVGLAVAQQDHDHAAHGQNQPGHGGTLATSKAGRHHFEVVFEKDGLKVFPQGKAITPELLAGLQGRAFFLFPGATEYSEPYALRPVSSVPDEPADALGLAVDLRQVPTEGTKVTFQVWALPGPDEPTAQFTVPFALASPAGIVAVKATEADRIGVAAQATCPISGENLEAMGGPVKVTRGAETLYLCCQGCLAKIKAEPDRYFGSVISAARATAGDKEAVAAQATCPISGKGLNAMGGPIKISRAGKSVFVCCPACIDAVKAKAATDLGSTPPATQGEHDPAGHDHDAHEQGG